MHMPKKLLAFLLIFVSLSACAFAWISDEGKISFSEPQGWKAEKDWNGVVFHGRPSYSGTITVNWKQCQDAEFTDELANQIIDFQKKLFENMGKKVLGARTVTVNGVLMVKFTVEDPDTQHMTTIYSAVHNYINYTFTLSSDKSAYSSVIPALDNMVKSAKFL